jgi:hypothetical protein
LRLETYGENNTVKGRAKLFDNYIPCIKDGCDEEHAEMILKVMIVMNEWIIEELKQRIHRKYNTNNKVIKHA